jgi:hypothetical protein
MKHDARPLRRSAARFTALALPFLLMSCGSPLVKPGPAVAAGRIAVDTPIAWTRINGLHGEMWTVDGALLDRVEFYSDVRDGEHVFKSRRATKAKPDGPFFHPGMDGPALAQLVADALAGLGAVKPELTGLRPAKFGRHDAVRFELRLSNELGLIYRGSALLAEVDGKLDVVLFLAPEEHYYDAFLPSVDAMLKSAHPR